MHKLDTLPFGMGIYASHRTNGDETTTALGLARDAGIKWTRDEIGWGPLQPTKDEWRWDKFDHAIDITREHGVQILGLLAYSAKWAASAETPDGEPDVVSMPDLGAWKEYVSAVVERYRDRIRVWQMWNEPNGDAFWHPRPDAREYARLLAAGYEAAKAVDPDCWVVGCNMSMVDLEYQRALFDEGGWEHCDVVGVQPYRPPLTPEHSDLLGDMRNIAALCDRFGGVRPIWITEIGYPTYNGPASSSEWWSAQMLMRTYLTAWSSGLVQKVFWYDYRDDGTDPGDAECNFGIVRRDWTPKPAYEALKTMATTLDGFQPEGRIDIGDDVRVLRFRRGDETRIAAWASGKNGRRPVPTPSDHVIVRSPWQEDREVAAPHGWIMLDLVATPQFLVPCGHVGNSFGTAGVSATVGR